MRTVAQKALVKPDNSFFPFYDSGDLQKLLDQPDPPVPEKLNLLLIHVCGLSTFPGQIAAFDYDHDYPIIAAKNGQEAVFYMQTLERQGLLFLEDTFVEKGVLGFKVSALGWTQSESISNLGGGSSNAFIAMWFDPSREPFERAISEGVANAGYRPIRIDRVEHLNRIDDEMIAHIRQSRFLIADFTGQRNGVYFEAGFMLGLGRPVIWVCEKTDLSNVHFDTRQYNIIDYSNAEELTRRLQFRIEANLGKGSYSLSG